MLAFSKSKLAKIPDEIFMKYGVFDEYGDIVGVKEDAPAEFKEAYEHDKKMYDDTLAQGIQL